MTNIEEIELQQNCVEELPFSFGNLIELRRLTISCVNFKILPECLSECHHLVEINVNDCESLEEIRGIPPNLEKLSARGCESLCPSSRRMLLSQKLHAAGSTSFSFPNGSEGIPDWFEHQSREDTISFWFRKNIPSITCISLIPEFDYLEKFKLFLNDNEITPTDYLFYIDEVLSSEQAFLFDLKLVQRINESFANKPELYEAFNINEWNHVELNWKIIYWIDMEADDHDSAQMGIHVSSKGDDFSDMEESNTEGDVVFTDPTKLNSLRSCYSLNLNITERRSHSYILTCKMASEASQAIRSDESF